ncbi:hypothetical protein OZX56_00340 [Lactobacillus sp. ESL0684]|uniref:hypothetical protein n=1 Tax=Lactobacillus sp. ESL0684 TaxID=2983213 RepID=UPI0023F7048B|nr:hypothetical protein [Lactobacillus sp. ESL0684]WEV43722.1 hypothetical protein OZX56_00340 [Lactobacillus sp. ESL0684]
MIGKTVKDDYIKLALKKDGKLKLILKGATELKNDQKIGVVSVIYITRDVELAKKQFEKLTKHKENDDFYMIYSCDEDTYLPELEHYPSIEISKEDLQD